MATGLMLTDAAIAEACGAKRWQQLLRDALPYESRDALLTASERAFDRLEREDWLEAFAAHSSIGTVRSGDRIGASEQSGMEAAGDELRRALAEANVEYQARFGFVFLIRANGRSAAEMLEQLRLRLQNAPELEFRIACGQLREITALRLDRLARVQTETERA